MVLNELAIGSSVELTAIIGTQRLVFQTEIVNLPTDDKKVHKALQKLTNGYPYVAVPVIRQNDKVVGFPTSGVVYQVVIVNKEDEKVYQWVSVAIRQVKLPDLPAFHIIISNKAAKEYNRRQRYRLWLGIDGVASIGLSRKPIDVLVKDISSTGISFIARNAVLEEKNITINHNTFAVLTFFDEPSGTNFRISCIVIRAVAVDEQRTLYGCKFAEENQLIGQFVNKRQREKIKDQRK